MFLFSLESVSLQLHTVGTTLRKSTEVNENMESGKYTFCGKNLVRLAEMNLRRTTVTICSMNRMYRKDRCQTFPMSPEGGTRQNQLNLQQTSFNFHILIPRIGMHWEYAA